MNESKPQSTYQFAHPALGEIVGTARGDDVVQFRGVPFADIPGRFRQAALRTSLPVSPFDATLPGPTCPQSLGGTPAPVYFDGPPAQDGIQLPEADADEFKCLNLNITVSKASVGGDIAPAPVLVYIHGGGFATGSSTMQVAGREMWDAARWVQHADSQGKPLVIVTINYRVGILGFLASKELEAYNRTFDEPTGNYGLHDQRQAIEWVARFIGAFGGDSGNITIQGGSAGGASSHFQAIFPQTKVKRAILSSGTVLTIGAMSQEQHQEVFDRYTQLYHAFTDVVGHLQGISVETLIADQLAPWWRPVIDGYWVPGKMLEAYRAEQCSDVDLLVGSCSFEQDLYLAMFTLMSPRDDKAIWERIVDSIQTSALTKRSAELLSKDLLALYGLDTTTERPTKNIEGWAEFMADLTFRIPPLVVALQQRKSKAFVYEFEATSPYRGWALGYRKAHHACSDMFIFDPASDLVEDQHRDEYSAAVEQVRQTFSSFCYGELDWQPFHDSDHKTMGPVHTISNHGAGRKYDNFDGFLGNEKATRWRRLLEIVLT